MSNCGNNFLLRLRRVRERYLSPQSKELTQVAQLRPRPASVTGRCSARIRSLLQRQEGIVMKGRCEKMTPLDFPSKRPIRKKELQFQKKAIILKRHGHIRRKRGEREKALTIGEASGGGVGSLTGAVRRVNMPNKEKGKGGTRKPQQCRELWVGSLTSASTSVRVNIDEDNSRWKRSSNLAATATSIGTFRGLSAASHYLCYFLWILKSIRCSN